jgi:hypothetical protein
LETVVWRCRERYNAGLQEHKAAWETGRVCVTFAMQSAQLPAIKEVRPEYRDINVQALQEVLHRLDTAFAACGERRLRSPLAFAVGSMSHRYTTSCKPNIHLKLW